MDPSSYKSIATSRGLKYNYYFSPSVEFKPTLLFLHGFPSTSQDWYHQVAFFQKEGYGLIVPDTLGYGGSDKPKDPSMYRWSMISADIIDILNNEKVDRCIAIGHDWGSGLTGRLALYYPERFIAFGFLAVGYLAPSATISNPFGYFLYFAQEGTDKVLEGHYDSVFSMLYPHDAELWKSSLCPIGATEAWILADKQVPLPSYLTSADAKKMKQEILSGGLTGPLNYYRAIMMQIQSEDDKNVPKGDHTLDHPVFYGAATRDYVCVTDVHKEETISKCRNLRVREFDTGHWLPLSLPDELNTELLAWIEDINK